MLSDYTTLCKWDQGRLCFSTVCNRPHFPSVPLLPLLASLLQEEEQNIPPSFALTDTESWSSVSCEGTAPSSCFFCHKAKRQINHRFRFCSFTVSKLNCLKLIVIISWWIKGVTCSTFKKWPFAFYLYSLKLCLCSWFCRTNLMQCYCEIIWRARHQKL